MAAYVWGYRAALLISGAGAIKSADIVGWHGALLGVAALIALGPVITLLAPEPCSAAKSVAVESPHALLPPSSSRCGNFLPGPEHR